MFDQRKTSLVGLLCLAGLGHAQVPVFELHGAAAGDNFGSATVRIGDLNGDGVDDLLVSAPRADFNGSNSGSVYAISARDGAPLYRIDGSAGSELFGQALDALGDVDGDGLDDWVVGAPFASSGVARNGRIELRSGLDGAIIRSMWGIEQFGNLGTAVAGLGDVDGDLIPDFVGSGPFEDSNGQDAGSVYLYSGATGGLIRAHFGAQTQENYGLTLAGCGDVDGDGIDDYAAGSTSANVGLGLVDVWSGQGGTPVQQFLGTLQTGPIGAQLASLGDMNGDGLRELGIGAPQDNSGGTMSGAAFVYSVQGAVLVHALFGSSGESIAFGIGDAGDWDGDGQVDWLVGRHDAGQQGGAVLLSGTNATQLAAQPPAAGNDLLGVAFAGGFELNGDGRAEFVVADPLADNAGTDSGSVLMVSSISLLGTPFCFGDGSATPCPCGNNGATGAGCAHSGGQGARLEVTGSASAAADDLRLFLTSGVADKPSLLFAGTQDVNGGLGVLFGDGLRCAGGTIQRLGVRFTDGLGAASWGPGILASQGWGPGESRVFQVWYRDGLRSPCGSQFNLSNGVDMHFLP